MKYFYVVCPVSGDPFFPLKKAALEKLGADLAVTPFFPLHRRDDFTLFDAKRDICGAKFVLGDLSLERPSCYFELGLAQALDARCFLIAELGTPIHQVSGRSEVAFYRDIDQYRSEVSRVLAAASTLLG